MTRESGKYSSHQRTARRDVVEKGGQRLAMLSTIASWAGSQREGSIPPTSLTHGGVPSLYFPRGSLHHTASFLGFQVHTTGTSWSRATFRLCRDRYGVISSIRACTFTYDAPSETFSLFT